MTHQEMKELTPGDIIAISGARHLVLEVEDKAPCHDVTVMSLNGVTGPSTLANLDNGIFAALWSKCATEDKPLAGPGLISYRYRGRFGYIMIGARDHQDALREAARSSTAQPVTIDNLEMWDGDAGLYKPVA